MIFVLLNSFQVPCAIAWALVCSCKPSRDLFVFIARLKSALVLICACHVHAVYLCIFLPLGLGLGAPCWLILGVACFLPTARGFT